MALPTYAQSRDWLLGGVGGFSVYPHGYWHRYAKKAVSDARANANAAPGRRKARRKRHANGLR